MFVKKVFNKLYLKLIFFSLVFFLSINQLAISAVLTEDEIKYIESQNENPDDEESYIKYEDIEKKKKKLDPFKIFKKKKTSKKVKKKDNFVKKDLKFSNNEIKVGVLLPLSGKYSYVGESILDSMQLVVSENKNLNIELIIKDTKANPERAKKEARNLIEKNVEIILGPFFSSSLESITNIAKYNKIPIISFSNDYKIKDQGIYLMGFEPEKQIKRVTEYVIKRNYKRYAALLPNTNYGKRMLYSYRNILKNYQIPLSKVELYDPKKKKFEKHIQNLVGLDESPKIEKDQETGENPLDNFDPGFDVLLVIESGPDLKHISALLTYYGVDLPKIKLIGTGEWLEKNIGSEPGLVGAWFASPNPKLWDDFEKKFFNIYKYKPIRLSSLGHDSIIAVTTVSKLRESQKFLYKDFQNKYGFTGIDGKFRFLPDGTVERNLAIIEIRDKKFKIQKQANNNFF